MTIEQQLRDPFLRKEVRHLQNLAHRASISEQFGEPVHESSFEIVHRGFLLRREPEFQMWQVLKDGQQVTGLHGLFTSTSLAKEHIDRFLKDQDEKAKNNAEDNKTHNE